MAFGKRPTVNHPFSPNDRSSYHCAELVAEANWEPDGGVAELPASEVHPRPHWRIKLNGEFPRNPSVDVCPSFSWPGAVIKVCVSFNFLGGELRTDGRMIFPVPCVPLPIPFGRLSTKWPPDQAIVNSLHSAHGAMLKAAALSVLCTRPFLLCRLKAFLVVVVSIQE
jgi:hypothetical protein